MAKRIERIERIKTDFESPLARPFPPQAGKIRFYPFNPFHPFSNHVAFSKERRSLKKREAHKRRRDQIKAANMSFWKKFTPQSYQVPPNTRPYPHLPVLSAYLLLT